MKKIIVFSLFLSIGFTLSACEKADNEPIVEEEVCYAPQDYSETLTYELVWSDEFDGTELDTTKWYYEVNGYGGGNNEEQYYTDENVVVSEGILKIIAEKEEYNGMQYTSSRITTKNKAEFKYGIFEARIKLPAGRGTWPAFWMMPVYSRYGIWPRSGEIDIMEHVGYDLNHIHSTIHTRYYNGPNNTQLGGGTTIFTDVTEEFHVYKVEWLPDRMIFHTDDKMVYTYKPNNYSSCVGYEIWPFNSPFFMILNLAIGGDWGGQQGIDDTIFPVQMEIDYVRVYQALELENYDDNSTK